MAAAKHILVCPPDRNLLGRLHGRSVVVNVYKPDQLLEAAEMVGHTRNRLHAIRAFFGDRLADLHLSREWATIPMGLYLRELGPYREVVEKVRTLKALNARVYLRLDSATSYTDARLLSSLGIATVVIPGLSAIDWEALIDLATYALLGLSPHAPIDPFSKMAREYDPARILAMGDGDFNDPARFLHLSPSGQVALDENELRAGNFALDSVDQVDRIHDCASYQERLAAWRRVFLRFEGCSTCPAWQVCLGQASRHDPTLRACRKFYGELVQVLEEVCLRNSSVPRLWQT